jgi:Esterase-like activity of phytase
VGEASPVSARPLEASPEFDLAIGQDAPELVGLDALPSGTGGRDLRLFSIHRSSSALSSNAITIVETQLEATFDQTNLPARVTSEIEERSRSGYRVTSSRVLAEMNVFVTIDNFEGIAARALPDGRVRLYVISDDNFSAKQRTLLMIYETRA